MQSGYSESPEGNSRKRKASPIKSTCNKNPIFKPALATIVSFVKTSKKYPQGKARNAYEGVGSFHLINKQLCQRIQQVTALFINLPSRSRPTFSSMDQEQNNEIVEQANDHLMDRSSANMDIAMGLREPDETVDNKPTFPVPKKKKSSTSRPKDLCQIKPQDEYKDIAATIKLTSLMDFKGNDVFKPLLTEKPNALDEFSLVPIYDNRVLMGYENPYVLEINSFEYGKFCHRQPKEAVPPPVDPANAKIVDNVIIFQELVDHLKEVPILAVDVEHNSYRSYHGLTCLIQITTKTGGDFILDVFKLWTEIPKLNAIFTDPNKIKVFHGAHQDIRWLQRDFGIYVVGLFDTFDAAKLLGHKPLSLAYLILKYCGVEVDKTHAEFDWRVRPLPKDVIKYAMSDTHYLLYIYNVLVNDLIEKTFEQNLFELIIKNGMRTAAQVYQAPLRTELVLDSLIPDGLDDQQKIRMGPLLIWRQEMAYKLDESPSYICSKYFLANIAKTLPKDKDELLKCLTNSGFRKSHPLMTDDVMESILSVIHMKTDNYQRASEPNPTLSNMTDDDFSHLETTATEEAAPISEDLPTVLGTKGYPEVTFADESPGSAMCEIFKPFKLDQPDPNFGIDSEGVYLTPYERHFHYRVVAEAIENKNKARNLDNAEQKREQ